MSTETPGLGATQSFRSYLLGIGITDAEIIAASALKFHILSSGLQISGEAAEALSLFDPVSAARPRRTRSGVSGGLDLLLAESIHVNAPVLESFALDSLLKLHTDAGVHISGFNGDVQVRVVEAPEYYGRLASDEKTALDRVAQMCSADRLCFGITGPGCSFWPRDDRCRYCSIGFNYSQDASRKNAELLLEVVEVALSDSRRPARHLLLGGGTPPGDDMGAEVCAALVRQVKEAWDIPIYVMIAAPLKDRHIDALIDAGVDELGMNLEFWSAEAWRNFIPGKERRIGRARYVDALRYAVDRLGPAPKTRSILIAGLEPFEHTLEAVDKLCSWGVMPIISPFRPLDGTSLQTLRGPNGYAYQDFFVEASRIATGYGLKLGPACPPCQNNVLALPF